MMNVQQPSLPQRAVEAGDDSMWPPQWMLDLERAHDRLGRAAHLLESGAQPGPVDLRPAAEALSRVFGGIFDAYDGRQPRFEALKGAIAALDEGASLLAPATSADAAVGFAIDYLREVRTALLEAQERVAHLVHRPPAPAPDLHGGFEVPPLHDVDRASLVPRLRVPDPKLPDVEVVPKAIERPRTFEDLARIVKELKEAAAAPRPPRPQAEKKAKPAPPEPPPGFSPEMRPALSDDRFLLERVRHCFEEITMIGVQRAPLLGDPWRGSRTLERRMVASIDAIAAMGPKALGALEELVLDAPLKDPPRVFAIAMTMGCITGRDALAMAERAFAAFEIDDPEHAAQLGAALKLVPHPHLSLLLRTFLADSDPARRALAIDVLAYRGMTTPEELGRAAADEPAVLEVALPWLALTRHPSLRQAVDAALESPVPGVRTAARRAMVLGGDVRAVGALRTALDAEPEEADPAASLLGIVCGPAEAEVLVERAKATPTRQSVAAVGWTGWIGAMAPLMAFLRHEDDAVVLAAAYALDRITNAGLYEDAIVEEDEIVSPDIPEPDMGEGPPPPPLARAVSDPRDLPAEPSTETLRRPTTDLARWTAWWNEKRDAFDPKARWRRGYAYVPLVSWRELDLWQATPGERRLLQTELVARTGDWVRFDPHDFVPVQEASVAAWEEPARRASGAPGSWNLPVRRNP
jgi:hypothetical protein